VEHGQLAHDAVAAMTTLVARHVDLSAVVAVAASQVIEEPWQPQAVENTGGNVTVAMAAGKAFSFSYTEHAELLRAAGASVVEFDPMTQSLPPETSAVVLPGGFPEQFAAELSANSVVQQQIRDIANRGAPVQAECGAWHIWLTTSTVTRCAVRCPGQRGSPTASPWGIAMRSRSPIRPCTPSAKELLDTNFTALQSR